MAYQETTYQVVNVADASGNIISSFGGVSGGDASSANQAIEITKLTSIDGKIPALVSGRLPVDVQSLNLTVSNAQLEIANDVGNPIPVNGTVAFSNTSIQVSNFPTTQPVSATSLPLPSGAATDATLSNVNTKLPSGLTVTSTRLLVDNSGVTQPVSASNLPLPTGAATSIKQPALGTAGSPSTDVLSFQGVANGTPISTIITDTYTTGTITTADVASSTATGANNQSIITGTATSGSFVSIAANGYNSFTAQVAGSWTGTLQFEVSFDNGTIWYPSSGFSVGTSYTAASTTLNGAFRGNATDATNVRVRATSAVSGTANIRITLSQTIDSASIRNPIRLFDSTSGVQATIKSASAAAVSTDTAQVFAQRPAQSATILSLQTSATGTSFATFSSQACTELTIQNLSGTSLEYRRGGSESTFQIPNNTAWTVEGVTDASNISLRRIDQSNTQVFIAAEALVR